MNTKEKYMREFEDICQSRFLPKVYIAVRLDGRSFSSLTNTMDAKKPFDDRFQCIMSTVTYHLMRDSGFNIVYGYHQSDEISLLFKFDVYSFDRRISKYISILSSLSSSLFTKHSGQVVSFDCRIIQLPTINEVVDYFQWRQEDAARNCLNGYCYWKLREKFSQKHVVKFLNKKNAAELQEILFQEGINYNDISSWKKRGIGFYWVEKEKEGKNPMTGESVLAKRKTIYEDKELQYGCDYSKFIKERLLPVV
jgi:tRNA(His) 5'-end guanylyltransferase